MSLLALPHELLLEIMEHLRDSQAKKALQSIASTCKVLHDIAEAYLYSAAVFITQSSFDHFLRATAADSRRSQYLQDLKLAFSTRQYDYGEQIVKPNLKAFENMRTFVSESAECQPWAHKGTVQWKVYMDAYMHLFEQASLLNDVPELQISLPKLTSLTLHWTGQHSRYWDISPACPIFLIPQLQSLEISCARIGQAISGPVGIWDEELLKKFSRKTELKSLALIECTVSVEALEAILSLPAALKRLHLYETTHHEIDVLYDRFATADSDLFNRAIAQQCDSLAHVEIMACPSYASLPGNISRPLALALGDFRVLTHLRLGPFRTTRRAPGQHSDLCGLKHPPPPALESLRLDDFLLSLLTPRAANEVLSELLVDELMVNAAARGVAFQLDIALARMTAYLQRLQRIKDQRPLVRKLVQGFAENFYQRRPRQHRQHHRSCSGGGSSSASSSEEEGGPGSSPEPDTLITNKHQSSSTSRLRILTSKRVRVIPPYLHAEKRPRFVVRYDSWHPRRFVPDAHLASIDYSDDDISSEDEDVEAAFHEP